MRAAYAPLWRNQAGWLLLVPAMLFFTLFVVLPMGEAAWYSLHRWNGFGDLTDFVGLRNFERLLAGADFRTAMLNNGLVIAVSLAVQLPLALLLALLLADATRANQAYRLLFFLPFVLADVAAGLIWRFLLDGDQGLPTLMGQPAPQWLADPVSARVCLLGVVVWKYFGFHMVLLIAALQSIDGSLYEAARMDAASRWRVFRRITLPQLAPTLRLCVFFSVLGALQLFDLVMPITQGGPSNSTHTLVSFLYQHGATRMDVGFGSAAGVLLFLLCLGFALGWQRWDRRRA
ncbi:MAG: sugar ABC transporter permease [Burkholderiales bacterium]|nr:sugar ABC transporter permease [Burkholderiales bacterium]